MTTQLAITTACLMLCLSAPTEAADVTGHWAVTITTADGTDNRHRFSEADR